MNKILNKNTIIGGLIIGYIITGLGNNVGVIVMGKRMPPYAEFLLYGTTAMYTAMFYILSIMYKENRKLTYIQHKNLMWLGLWTSLNGVFAQISVPFLSSELTNLLTTLSIPCTWLSARYMFNHKIDGVVLLCYISIISGLLLGVIPSLFWGSGDDNTNPALWIILTIISTIPTAFETTYQERAFNELNTPMFITLTYYNLYSLIVYFVTCPIIMINKLRPADADSGLTFDEVLTNQGRAFSCYFGNSANVPGCYQGAILWTTIFTVCYVGWFSFGAILIQKMNSNIIAILNALLIPLGAMCFWWKDLVDSPGGGAGPPVPPKYYAAEKPVWWIGVSVSIIAIFSIFYVYWTSYPKFRYSYFGRKLKNSFLGNTIFEGYPHNSEINMEEVLPLMNNDIN